MDNNLEMFCKTVLEGQLGIAECLQALQIDISRLEAKIDILTGNNPTFEMPDPDQIALEDSELYSERALPNGRVAYTNKRVPTCPICGGTDGYWQLSGAWTCRNGEAHPETPQGRHTIFKDIRKEDYPNIEEPRCQGCANAKQTPCPYAMACGPDRSLYTEED